MNSSTDISSLVEQCIALDINIKKMIEDKKAFNELSSRLKGTSTWVLWEEICKIPMCSMKIDEKNGAVDFKSEHLSSMKSADVFELISNMRKETTLNITHNGNYDSRGYHVYGFTVQSRIYKTLYQDLVELTSFQLHKPLITDNICVISQ